MRARTPGWPVPRSRTQPTLPERGQGGPEARRDPPQGRGGAGPGRTPAQCGRGMASSLAEMAGLPGGDAPAGCTHPAGANPLGGGVPGRQALRFRPEPGEPVPHPGRRDAEGGGAAPEEGLYVNPLEEDPGSRGGNRPGGVIRVPAKPPIPGLRSSPLPAGADARTVQ